MAGRDLFPERSAEQARRMSVGEGHLLYVEEFGAVDGLPVVFLHDGPGGACSPEHRRLFDPRRLRAILLDQRGCGRSLPSGAQEANSTPYLIGDLEHVRNALGIDAWIVFGRGWGALLALAYAQLFPERGRGLVLSEVFLATPEELAARRRSPGRDADTSALAEHYLAHDCFVDGEALLDGVAALADLPAIIVQGKRGNTMATRLREAWPAAGWIPDSGERVAFADEASARDEIKALAWMAAWVSSPHDFL